MTSAIPTPAGAEVILKERTGVEWAGARAPAESSLALHDRLQWPAGLTGVVAQAGGDAGEAGQPEDGDGQVGWP